MADIIRETSKVLLPPRRSARKAGA
jgi:hypothetical protein